MKGSKLSPSRNPNSYPMTDEIKFSSVKELIKQLEKDKSNCLLLKYKYELGEEDAYI